MTNLEKFKEVFGIMPNTNECPIFCQSTRGDCQNDKYNFCVPGAWWDLEYKEQTDGKDNN